MLIDRATIIVRSGKGGDGCVSFRREKFAPKGGPDGGDGGDGGSVVLVAWPGVDTLLDFAGRHHWFAPDGERGGGRQCHGLTREDLEVRLPSGTLVYDGQSNELLADLDVPGRRLVVARGGQGGFGNEHFKSPTNQTPRNSTPGEPGQELTLRLELKLIADVGLVGLPNAGKSTLLAAITRARPKIADYPFTTLEPHIGIVELPGGGSSGAPRRMVVADLPGLIEGAHQGQGLGTRFLRHVERTRLLVHLLDADPIDGSDPISNYRIIREELAGYSEALAEKPQIVAINKMDLLPNDDDRAAAVDLIEPAIEVEVFAISAATGIGVAKLLEACWHRIRGDERQNTDWPK